MCRASLRDLSNLRSRLAQMSVRTEQSRAATVNKEQSMAFGSGEGQVTAEANRAVEFFSGSPRANLADRPAA